MRVGITYNLKSNGMSFPRSPKIAAKSVRTSLAVFVAEKRESILDPNGSPIKTFGDDKLNIDDQTEEFDSPETIEAIHNVLTQEGHQVHFLGGDLEIARKIKNLGIEFVFNIAEGISGRSREAHIPAVLELLGIPYSGSDPLALALTLDKALTKRIAQSLLISTPKFLIAPSPIASPPRGRGEWQDVTSRFWKNVSKSPLPLGEGKGEGHLFLKPCWEGSSKGIRLSSKVNTKKELEKEMNRLSKNYPGIPILIEEYIAGRELTVGVIGNKNPQILGIMEMTYKKPPSLSFPRKRESILVQMDPRLKSATKKADPSAIFGGHSGMTSKRSDFCYSLEVKRNWKELVEYRSPAKLNATVQKKIENAALLLFKTLGLRDVARFDFRLAPAGKFYFLEVNPLPGLNPESGDLVIMAEKNGWSYEKLVCYIFRSAMERCAAALPAGKEKCDREFLEVEKIPDIRN